MLKRLFLSMYSKFEEEGYFQEYFGYDCVDAGYVKGLLGEDIEGVILLNLRKDNLWPIQEKAEGYGEEDLFDMIEFLFDSVSYPIDGYHHTFANCGWHYNKFDKKQGQIDYRKEINRLLKEYNQGYELSTDGDILGIVEKGFENLFEAKIPSNNEESIIAKLERAKVKFRKHSSSWEDRRDVIRELADILEYVRPSLKKVMDKKDEADLFNIINNFGIRHHNESQKANYDKPIWLSWMFYFFLATIHAVLRFIEKGQDS